MAATITAAMVKQLREMTSVGMSDCKKALVEADGDFDRAVELLREKGLAMAAKKAGRIASEGLSAAYITDDNTKGVLVEVNSETDFVAKNQDFQSYVAQVARQAAQSSAAALEDFLQEKWIADESVTVQEALTQKIAVISERLDIRRFERFERQGQGALVSYVHGGGRVAVLLELASEAESGALTEAGKNICMQIAAMSPRFVSRADISEEFLEKEKEILTQQSINEEQEKARENPGYKAKPPQVLEKIIAGRLEKEIKDFCLLTQEYVKDSELTVGGYLESVSKKIGPTITVKRFARYATGEGLAKKEENFAEEVNKAMGQS
ncbi:MAG: translation elongation factor Ts [Clostridiales bacterium]|jgi:elongation factor Ts|nr:translation elongation factor Ts [Clostridiales bacterium]